LFLRWDLNYLCPGWPWIEDLPVWHGLHTWATRLSSLLIFFSFLIYLRSTAVDLRALSHSSPFLWWGFFEIGSHELFCPGRLQTTILLISTFWIARITGVSH
jgi:hypothetical protein